MWCIKNGSKTQWGKIIQCVGYLKFVTLNFPDGLFSGLDQAKKFNSIEEAEKVIRTISNATQDENWANSLEIVSFEREREKEKERLKKETPKRINVWTKEFWGG